jgi:hypothetical protein
VSRRAWKDESGQSGPYCKGSTLKHRKVQQLDGISDARTHDRSHSRPDHVLGCPCQRSKRMMCTEDRAQILCIQVMQIGTTSCGAARYIYILADIWQLLPDTYEPCFLLLHGWLVDRIFGAVVADPPSCWQADKHELMRQCFSTPLLWAASIKSVIERDG